MTKPLSYALLAIATLGAATPATSVFADESTDRSVAIIPRAGMLGIGADLSIPLNDSFNARVGYGSSKRTRTITENDIEYDGQLKLAGGLAVIDWFPTGGNFRLSAGVARNQSRIAVTARPTTTVTFGNTTYGGNEINATGELNFVATAPYIGIGYGNASARSRLGFFIEGGLIRQKTKATLDGTCTAPALDPTACDTFNADLAQERAELQDSARKYRWFPVLQLGMSIRF